MITVLPVDQPTMNKSLTILTDPVPTGRFLLPELSIRSLRSVRNLVKGRSWWNSGFYRGHFAVTRSLVEGLRKLGLPFAYNPISAQEISDVVLVLSGVRALRQAILLKRKGKVRHIVAGPNIVVFPTEAGAILASREVDLVISPCDWSVDAYVEDIPGLRDRMWAWPAGVDTDYWRPDATTDRSQVLIYEKQAKGPVGPVEPYAEYLRLCGETVSIIRYGEYTHADYLRHLQRSKLMIGFVTDESQGLAWAEAWSCNVPTLIWRNEKSSYRGRSFRCSTAPYLTGDTGLFFDDLEDFKAQFARWQVSRHGFRPRDWVLENMSDEVCARALYERAMAC